VPATIRDVARAGGLRRAVDHASGLLGEDRRINAYANLDSRGRARIRIALRTRAT
jgi:hypothetical protein